MIGLLIGGTVVLCAGLLTVVFGIPIKEFSFGNTMILAGAIVSCTGLVLIGLYFVGREFRTLARRLEAGAPPVVLPRDADDIPPPRAARDLPQAPPRPAPPRSRDDMLFTRDQPVDPESARDDFSAGGLREDRARTSASSAEPDAPSEPAPWQEHPLTRARHPAPSTEQDSPARPPERQRRNIMFSSSRRDKNRDLPARDPESREETAHQPPDRDTQPRDAGPESADPFSSAWPRSPRARQDYAAPQDDDRNASAPEPEREAPEPMRERFQLPRRSDASSVTIVKSGVVDSMAYSLYSDGSIEAQMPEGMVRFASIDELRAHLDQRS